MKKLRLLLFEKCNRSCEECCNKGFDLNALPVVQNYSEYEEIVLTGGEPMLNVPLLLGTVSAIREANPEAKILVYTAKINRINLIWEVLKSVDGLTVALHEQKDVIHFLRLNEALSHFSKDYGLYDRSLRLNVFKGVAVTKDRDLPLWGVKRGIEWIKDCPLPTDEVFMRLGDA